MKFTKDELDILECVVENEIKSDTDYLNYCDKTERKYWKNYIISLKKILKKIKEEK